MTFGSLFAGIGGLDLGLKRAGMRCLWQVEIDEYCRRVLAKHWPDVERYEDVRECGAHNLKPVDLICGGFPCQDISSAHTAGQRQGLRGASSGLWLEHERIIGELRPAWAIVENVDQWRAWVPVVRSALSVAGYSSVPIRLYAGSFGAPHPRARVFVVGYTNGHRQPACALYEKVARLSPMASPSGHWGELPPGVSRVDDGIPFRMERTRALGNAVVPQVAEWIGRRIMEADVR